MIHWYKAMDRFGQKIERTLRPIPKKLIARKIILGEKQQHANLLSGHCVILFPPIHVSK